MQRLPVFLAETRVDKNTMWLADFLLDIMEDSGDSAEREVRDKLIIPGDGYQWTKYGEKRLQKSSRIR